MKILQGKNGEVKIFTDLVEDAAVEQVQGMADHEISENAVIRIMPDVHAGKGSTVGTTIKLSEDFNQWKVSPNVVGVDVGCGILMYKVKTMDNAPIDLQRLDSAVNALVPAGFNVHSKGKDTKFTMNAIKGLTFPVNGKTSERIHTSLGTLGGGNHFIELGVDENGDYWLSVHSGSRNLGVQVARTHQEIAIKRLHEKTVDLKGVIAQLKAEGRHSEIQATVEKIKSETPEIDKDAETLAYLAGDDLKNYLNDMEIAQEYAAKSRATMLAIIVEAMELEVTDSFDSVHNFIEQESGTIRKGATSAKDGERLVIPLNMRDGSLIAMGKGNKDWNESAPHGAGRMMSRSQARRELSMDDFKSQMSEVYTTSVMESTIDEAPEAYKPAQSIIDNIKDTVDIVHLVKPIYNFKAHE